MQIKNIKLSNYRNIQSANIDFSPKINLFYGQNAQGKTNLLEAVYFCSIGKSLRVTKDSNLIKFNCEQANIQVSALTFEENRNIDIIIGNEKKIEINGNPTKRVSELVGQLKCIYFSPDDLKIIKLTPEERRRFMDIDLSQLYKTYLYSLSRYNNIIKQRNILLKNPSEARETLEIWDVSLAKEAAYITEKRREFIKSISPHIQRIYSYLTDGKESLEISYIGKNDENLEESFLFDYQHSFEKDIQVGFTTIGPHRDDVEFISNGKNLKLFGSQGQQRTAVLSLKLAEMEVYKDSSGEYPILLLDDVLSELDKNRQDKLIEYTSRTQVLLTGTSNNEIITNDKNNAVFYVEKGVFSKEN